MDESNKPSTSSVQDVIIQPPLTPRPRPAYLKMATGRQLYTNKSQFKCMIEFIAKNHNHFIIRAVPSDALELKIRKQKWEELKKALNLLGPPTLETEKWKRVWKDWKYNIRIKIRKSQESNIRRLILTDEEIHVAELLNIYPIENSNINIDNLVNNKNDDNHKKATKRRKNYASFSEDKKEVLKDVVVDDDKDSLHSLPAQLFMPLLMKQMENQTLFLQQISETLKDMKSISAENLNQQKKNHKLKKHLIAMNED